MTQTNGDSGTGAAWHPDAQLLVQEKLRILRLLRALDRAGVDPEKEPGVRVPLVRLGELDAHLTAMLEFVDREGGELDAARELRAQIHKILPVAEAVRGDVRDAVPAQYGRALRRASSEVVAREAEIQLELDAFRRSTATEGRRGGGGHGGGPVSQAEAEALAEETWSGKAPPGRLRMDRRVDAHEKKALPNPEAPLRTWFDRTPRPWREAMAKIHDLPRKSGDALALRLTRRVGDPTWMRHFLADGLGTSEREMLARLLAIPVVDVDPGEALHEAFFVAWDWGMQFPAGVGAKLRAAGLVHVGTEAGRRLATIPPPLVPLLRELLPQVDPESAALPERHARHAGARILADTPFEDEELARWKEADLALSERFADWILTSQDRLRSAVDAAFEGLERAVYSPEDGAAVFEYGLLDWRDAPGRPTLAESRTAETTFGSPEERALATATLEARPALYRVESAERGRSVRITPLFPAGDGVDITDRSMSLTVEVGQLVALRVYPAGPFHFARVSGPPIEAELEKVVVRGLRRELRAFVRDGGTKDPETFLRVRPWTFLRLLRRHWN